LLSQVDKHTGRLVIAKKQKYAHNATGVKSMEIYRLVSKDVAWVQQVLKNDIFLLLLRIFEKMQTTLDITQIAVDGSAE
jgi:hypothetical protein